MAITAQDIAAQMIQQMRISDPSVSAEVGTPERKILDAVAEALSESQVDLGIVNGSLDLDSKFGTNLDAFLNLFGFGRQQPVAATGVVEFSRTDPAPTTIRIPSNVQISTGFATDQNNVLTRIIFETTANVFLQAGDKSVLAPIRATIAGSQGNVAANTIITFVGQPVLGVSAVINANATTGGLDTESDDELKVRFQNTVFRNLAGTEDQYLALAASGGTSVKAKVVGPVSRYREYIQVPSVDDASIDPGLTGGGAISGNGNAGEYTTVLSTIPYSKHVYDTIPFFVSNGGGTAQFFYTPDVDFRFNYPALDRGDTYRFHSVSPPIGVAPTDSTAQFQPNLTLLNVLPSTADDSISAIRAGDLVLFEHSYLSSASRNDLSRNITNAVDVFVDGRNAVNADVIIPKPTVNNGRTFNANPTSPFYVEKFRRIGEPEHRPVQGNYYTPVLWEPLSAVPDTIVVTSPDTGPSSTPLTSTYYRGVHFWAIEDVSGLHGTVRARNGLEWAAGIAGSAGDVPPTYDANGIVLTYGGPYFGDTIIGNDATSVQVLGYQFDQNIVELQNSLEKSKQVTTDVLVHGAFQRYFKLDITVMYSDGANPTSVNAAIQVALNNFFTGQYFGAAIQLSDLLQAIHNAAGVDNVRWSRDLPNGVALGYNRVVECDRFGNPRLGAIVDRAVFGTASLTEIEYLMITGVPTAGTYQISLDGSTYTSALAYNANYSTLQTALNTLGGAWTVDSATNGSSTAPFKITFPGVGVQANAPLKVKNTFTGGTGGVFNNDFFLKDNELPSLPTATISGDTVPGVIIRARAQGTWSRG